MNFKGETKLAPPPWVVATVHSLAGFRAALRLPPAKVDLLELRADAFAKDPVRLQEIANRLARLPFALLLTVRDPAEGGLHDLSRARRLEFFRSLLPLAALVDIELRNAAPFAELIAEAHKRKVRVLLSAHDFQTCPSTPRLRLLEKKALAAGADILKVAATLPDATRLAQLQSWLAEPHSLAISAMGMGALGPLSRLALGATGSVLNYGYLDAPNAPGQWPAALLKTRLAEIRKLS